MRGDRPNYTFVRSAQEGFAMPNHRDNALLGMIAESARNQSFTIIEPTGERSESFRCYACDLVGVEHDLTAEEAKLTNSVDTREENL